MCRPVSCAIRSNRLSVSALIKAKAIICNVLLSLFVAPHYFLFENIDRGQKFEYIIPSNKDVVFILWSVIGFAALNLERDKCHRRYL